MTLGDESDEAHYRQIDIDFERITMDDIFMATAGDPSSHGLSPEELEILDAARLQHPGWWKGLMLAAEIMPARNKKYSGAETTPWRNFIIMARILGQPVYSVFKYYMIIKLARIMVDFESGEDTLPDSARDLANYSLLEAGWRAMSRDEQLEHERLAGGWTHENV